MQGIIHGAPKTVGIRKAVTIEAALLSGRYTDTDRSKSIGYNGGDGLVIKIVFPSEELASRFISVLEIKLPLASLDQVDLQQSVCGKEIFRGDFIRPAHYDANESSSPSQSGASCVLPENVASTTSSSSNPHAH